jgi:flagellar hook-length control protein FliK
LKLLDNPSATGWRADCKQTAASVLQSEVDPVPSVASDTPSVLPRTASPSVRSYSLDGREPATPFADLLDSAEPAPAPRQADRADRSDPPKARDDGGADAPSANDSANANDTNDTTAAPGNGDVKNVKDTKEGVAADAGKKAKTGDAASAKTSDAAPAEAGKAKADVNEKTALDAMIADAAGASATMLQPVVAAVAQPIVLAAATTGDTAEAGAVAALQTSGGVAPNAAPKSGQVQVEKPAGTAAKAEAPADPQAGIAEIAGKDSQACGNGDKTAGEFRHAAADLLAKSEVSAPAQPGDAGAAVKAGADAVQNPGVAASAIAASATAAANAPAPPQAQIQAAAVPLAGLAVEIATQAHAGKTHFEIRLDPPELGRIDVKLDFDGDGNVSTRLIVDRADTLDLLKRDAASLERALQQSGLKTSDHALEFSLRQQGFARDDTAAQTSAQLIVPDDDPAPLEAMRQGYGRLLGLGRGLDIRV